MNVVLDAEARKKIAKFNLDVYQNIDGIIKLLFASISEVNVNEIFVRCNYDNKLNLFCDGINKEYYIGLEYRDEVLGDYDFLTFIDGNSAKKYKFIYDKNLKNYYLLLHQVILKKKSDLIIEVLFYKYGVHVNIYNMSKIYSYDIQGSNVIFDFGRFTEIMQSLEKIDISVILEKLQLCLIENSFNRILTNEYCGYCFDNDIFESNQLNIKKRYLGFSEGKC